MKKPVTTADIQKIQMDYFYSRPELLAEGLMFVDERTSRTILRECKKRGVDIVPHIVKMFDRQSVLMERLKSR